MSSQNESPILLPDDGRTEPGLEIADAPENTIVTDGGVAVRDIPENAALTGGGILIKQIPTGNIEIPDEDSPLLETGADRPGLDREKIYFMARPLNYFESLLEKHNLPSPIQEMLARVEVFEKRLPDVTPEEEVLLNSPLPYVRQKALATLEERGISSSQIQDFRRKDFAPRIIDASTLEFSWSGEKKTLPQALYAFFGEVIEDQLPEEAVLSPDSLRHLYSLFLHLEMIAETFQYRHQTYQLVNNELMDQIARKLEPWAAELEGKNQQHPGVTALFDFLSHFEIGSSAALKIFQKILSVYGENHPLRHQIAFQLSESTQSISEQKPHQLKPENIGIEIEGIPLVFTNKVPPGFAIGEDVSEGLPEIRREVESISFDDEFQRDLFELWYWAKISKLQGISVHIHLDDPGGHEIFAKFRQLLNYNDSLKGSSEGKNKTIEIRLPLESYGETADLTKPFFAEQFNLNLLIQELIRIKQSAVILEKGEILFGNKKEKINPMMGDFWKTRLVRDTSSVENNLLTYEKVLEVGEKSQWDNDVLAIALRKLPKGSLTYEKVLEVGEKSGWSWYPLAITLSKLPEGSLTYEKVLEVGEKSQWDNDVLAIALRKLPEGSLTYEKVLEVGEKSEWNIGALATALEKLPENFLTYDLVLTVGEQGGWNNSTLAMTLRKLPEGSLTYEKVLEVGEKGGWNIGALATALEKLPENFLTYDLVLTVGEQGGWNNSTLAMTLRKLPEGSLTYEKVLEVGEKSGWSWHPLVAALEKLPDSSLTYEEVLEVGEKSGWDDDVLAAALEKLPEGSLTYEKVLEVREKSQWNNDVLAKALRKLPEGSLTYEKVLEVGEKSGWDDDVLAAALEKFTKRTLTQSLLLEEQWKKHLKLENHLTIVPSSFIKIYQSLFDQPASIEDSNSLNIAEVIKNTFDNKIVRVSILAQLLEQNASWTPLSTLVE